MGLGLWTFRVKVFRVEGLGFTVPDSLELQGFTVFGLGLWGTAL